jgi:hypothetical protein
MDDAVAAARRRPVDRHDRDSRSSSHSAAAPRQRPPIHPPATICDHHSEQLRDRIGDIRRWWDVLPDLALASRDGGGGCGLNSQPPIRLDILALTDPHTADGGDIPPATTILTDIANWIAATDA